MTNSERGLRFEKLTERNFDLFRRLMCTDGISKQCFCLSHRVEPKDLELDDLAAIKMQQMVHRRKVNGLIASDNDAPIAWVGIEPFTSLVGHDVFELLLDNPRHGQFGEHDWAIHCLFVTPEARGEALTGHLVEHAIRYAIDRGAQRILAFPPPPERSKSMDPYDKYSGSPEMFLQKGFVLQGQLSPNTCLMVKKLTGARPRLSLEAPT